MLYTFFLIFMLLHASATEESCSCFDWLKGCVKPQTDEACENAAFNHCLPYCSIYETDQDRFDECMDVCMRTYVNTSTPTPETPKKGRSKFATFFNFLKEFFHL